MRSWHRALQTAAGVAATLADRVLARPELAHAIAAPRRIVGTSVGRISYYEDDAASGHPAVLLHDVGPAGCAFEVRALFDAFRAERPVVAADLPGYGFSERRSEPCSRADYLRFLEELLADVSRRYGAEVDLVAVGTAGELAAHAVLGNPRLARSLVLIAPTGFHRRSSAFDGAVDHGRRVLARALSAPFVGAAVHRGLTSRTALRAMAGRGAVGPLVDYAHAASFLPRARFAPLAAMFGGLSDRRIVSAVYERLPVPTCFVHGETLAGTIDALASGTLGLRSARVRGVHALPHIENPVETADALRAFWRTLAKKPELRLIRGGRRGIDPGARRHAHAPSQRAREGKRWT